MTQNVCVVVVSLQVIPKMFLSFVQRMIIHFHVLQKPENIFVHHEIFWNASNNIIKLSLEEFQLLMKLDFFTITRDEMVFQYDKVLSGAISFSDSQKSKK